MMSTAKEVKDKINEHILSYFTPVNYGSIGINDNNALDNLKEQVGCLHYMPNDYQRGHYMAEGGTFLIYYEDQRNFLNSLGINPDNKEYPNHKVFEQYCHLIGRQIAELVK